MLNYNLITENGWPKCDSTDCAWSTVPGTDVTLLIRLGVPTTILTAWAKWFNDNVEKLDDPQTGCYTADNKVHDSNHLSATAIDLNWQLHPFPLYTFDSQKIAHIREGLHLFRNCIWWGADWESPHDEMHFQLNYPEGDERLVKLAKDLSNGYLGLLSGGTTPPQSNREKYILAIIDSGRRNNITKRGICIAIAVALVESNLTMYANSNDQASLALWHEAVGSDHLSVGLFQQQPWWGSLQCRMNPSCSADLFFTSVDPPGLINIDDDYNDESNTPGYYAQTVQGSAYPSRYDLRWNEACALYDRFSNETLEGDDMTPEQDRMLRDLHAAFCEPISSGARYKNDGEGPIWTRAQFMSNDDALIYDLTVERKASEGNLQCLALVKRQADRGDQWAQTAWNNIAEEHKNKLTVSKEKEEVQDHSLDQSVKDILERIEHEQ